MKLSKNLGMILLAIWLVLTGLLSLFSVTFPGAGIILAILAIAAGAVILFGLRGRSLGNNIGLILLAIWLILRGLLSVFDISFAGSGIVLALLAIAAGVLLLIGR